MSQKMPRKRSNIAIIIPTNKLASMFVKAISNCIAKQNFSFRNHYSKSSIQFQRNTRNSGTSGSSNRRNKKMFRTKKYCSAVLDVAVVCDKVQHEAQTHKKKRMLAVNTNNILQSYLKNRKFRVKYNKYVTRDYMTGVPQGSVQLFI